MTEQTNEQTQATPPATAPARPPRRVPTSAERDQSAQANPSAQAKPEDGTMPKPTEGGGVSDDDPARPGFVRQPFAKVQMKLSAAKRPGFHRHWFNDVLDRIDQAKAAGYAHVSEERTGTPMKRVVGVAKGGGPLTAYLMEIPMKWFEEDLRAKDKVNDEIDEAIRGGNIARKDGDERYVPKDGIKLRDDD